MEKSKQGKVIPSLEGNSRFGVFWVLNHWNGLSEAKGI